MAGPRLLHWDGCVNVRDLGGYRTEDGRRTRFGAIVRSDNPAYLSPAGWSDLWAYGIRTVVALRTVGAEDREPEDNDVPGGLTGVHVDVEDITDREFFEHRVTNMGSGAPPCTHRRAGALAGPRRIRGEGSGASGARRRGDLMRAGLRSDRAAGPAPPPPGGCRC